jgi:uncharacterized protein YdcH (DUF465 family)
MDPQPNDVKSETKPVKLTKRGLPDRRTETSKKNLEKAKSVIKQALVEVKTKKQPVKVDDDESSDNYSTDEEEVELEEQGTTHDVSHKKEVKIETPIVPQDYTFTFEKKLNEQIEKLNNDYNLKISNIEKKTKEELEYLKKSNLELKKHLTSNFRTHQGVLNQEMYLKF